MNQTVLNRVRQRMQRFTNYPMSEAERSDMHHSILAQELSRYETEHPATPQYRRCLPESWISEIKEYNPDFTDAVAIYHGSRLG